jgi:hypothetical protein
MQISFLLGAGFSAPDGYPTRNNLNLRLRKILHSEIMIATDGTALFLNDGKDPNADWMNLSQRFFVEEFINFYNIEIIDGIELFDYEGFYDYYQGVHLRRFECLKFKKFATIFNEKHKTDYENNELLGDFHNTFNQLLASLLMRWPKKVHLAKPYTKYGEFLTFIETIGTVYHKIHFHTLNHDLLLEELSFSDAIQAELSDGFEELGSPYYSLNNDEHTVRLRRFTNNFKKKYCLYKLHGSIDNYVYNFQNKEFVTVKLPFGISAYDLRKEYIDENGDLNYDNCWWNYYPDFLSGTTEKINTYTEENFYKPLFNHFTSNLKNSSCLILIGYGLGDTKINEFIKNNFLNDTTKTMIIITPEKPNSDLFQFSNVKYYGENKGIQHINKEEIEKLLIK